MVCVLCRRALLKRHQKPINDQHQYHQNHHMIVGLVAAEPCETSSIGDRRHKGRLSEGRWVPCSDQQCCMITIMAHHRHHDADHHHCYHFDHRSSLLP